MARYLFELGRERALSEAEIYSVFSLLNVACANAKTFDKYLIVEMTEKIDAVKIMRQLGGTISIAEEIPFTSDVVESVVEFLRTNQDGKRVFSMRGTVDKKTALQIKKRIKEEGGSGRYIEPKNTATILHNDLVGKHGDFVVVGKNVFVTVAIQPIEEFSERDYGRPKFDSHSGMLPPKLARMMINLAAMSEEGVLLDPFCGSGTILTEAADIGYKNLIGSDIYLKAVADSKSNLEWIQGKLASKIGLNYSVLASDATKLHLQIPAKSIDGIVSEPFLGRPLHGTESRDFLAKQTIELNKLFIDSFKSFAKILKKGGTVIFIIPSFKFGDEWITIDCLEGIKKSGFNPQQFFNGEYFLRYARPDQLVARNIWKFILS